MSSSFVILSKNFLYDKSTSYLQSENKLSQSIFFRSERKFCSLKFLKFLWKISFLGVVGVGAIWNSKKLT